MPTTRSGTSTAQACSTRNSCSTTSRRCCWKTNTRADHHEQGTEKPPDHSTVTVRAELVEARLKTLSVICMNPLAFRLAILLIFLIDFSFTASDSGLQTQPPSPRPSHPPPCSRR